MNPILTVDFKQLFGQRKTLQFLSESPPLTHLYLDICINKNWNQFFWPKFAMSQNLMKVFPASQQMPEMRRKKKLNLQTIFKVSNKDTGMTSNGVFRCSFNPFLPNVLFWSHWKHQKTEGFEMFSGGSKEIIGKESVNVGYIRHTDLLLPFLILNICLVG